MRVCILLSFGWFLILIVACKYDQSLKSSIEMIDGKTFEVVRFLNDSLKSKIELIDNIRNGEGLSFYENGLLESESFWESGAQIGHYYQYFPIIDTVIIKREGQAMLVASNRLKSYGYYEKDTETFQITFDKNSKVVSTSGTILVSYEYNKMNFTLGDTVKYLFQFPNINVDSIASHFVYKTRSERADTIQLKVLPNYMAAYGSIVIETYDEIFPAVLTQIWLDDVVLSDTSSLLRIRPVIH